MSNRRLALPGANFSHIVSARSARATPPAEREAEAEVRYHPGMAIRVTDELSLPDHEIELTAIRAQGAGGQNVNKVASAVHLRFDIPASSLPEALKTALLSLRDRRISQDGVLVIKAQSHRTRERNREAALARLRALVERAGHRDAPRVPTRPSRAARRRRVDEKKQRGRLKTLRQRPED